MNNELKVRRDKSIFTGVLLGFLIVLACSCSPSLPSQQVYNMEIKPDIEYIEMPKEPEEDKAGKFITRVVQVSIVALSLLTFNGYMK